MNCGCHFNDIPNFGFQFRNDFQLNALQISQTFAPQDLPYARLPLAGANLKAAKDTKMECRNERMHLPKSDQRKSLKCGGSGVATSWWSWPLNMFKEMPLDELNLSLSAVRIPCAAAVKDGASEFEAGLTGATMCQDPGCSDFSFECQTSTTRMVVGNRLYVKCKTLRPTQLCFICLGSLGTSSEWTVQKPEGCRIHTVSGNTYNYHGDFEKTNKRSPWAKSSPAYHVRCTFALWVCVVASRCCPFNAYWNTALVSQC